MSDIVVSGLCLDSRRLKFGDLFIALRGISQDGREYIPMAIEKGAKAILVEGPLDSRFAEFRQKVPLIEFPDLRKSISHIASRFFEQPSQQLKVIGITGTNGKTSTAQWIAQLLMAQQQTCGLLGTLGQGFLNALKDEHCTTPNPIRTQEILASFYEQGARTVAMEVTSHALTQGRVEGVRFNTAIFTNLTRDHLDYHAGMEAYFQAKQRLFTEFKPAFCIINADDSYGHRLLESLGNREGVIGYSLVDTADRTGNKWRGPLIQARDLVLGTDKIQATLHSPWGEAQLLCPVLGRFNVSNVLAAIAAVCLQGLPFQETVKAARGLTAVPGRMLCLGGHPSQPVVVVDFAHTPDALAQVLAALRGHCQGRLWCVFGCGGDRDRGKRPEMGKVVEELADEIVITQDNSRTESFLDIQENILQGVATPSRIKIEPDRAKAIEWAVSAAAPNDLVLIAGKGHEQYQITQGNKIPFSDQTVAQQALDRRIACLN